MATHGGDGVNGSSFRRSGCAPHLRSVGGGLSGRPGPQLPDSSSRLPMTTGVMV